MWHLLMAVGRHLVSLWQVAELIGGQCGPIEMWNEWKVLL